ncbi:hypothetical protein F5Y16DRAFT_173505 [Xylariaceae sp. FL0255]|nr:hypothetical protein F5Y16DRAFT_173505 [Xylariaceae sp. FL0255]
MTQPPPPDSVRAIVEAAIPDRPVDSISTDSTQRLIRAFEVLLADGTVLILKLSPASLRQLRSEQWPVQSEVLVVEWLSQQPFTQGETYASKIRHGETSSGQSGSSAPLPRGTLAPYVPILIKHSSSSARNSTIYSLYQKPLGSPIASSAETLTREERSAIEFQKGRLMRHLADHLAPNKRFGLPVTVLSHLPGAKDVHKTAAKRTETGFEGANSWGKAFHSLLEGILRDGEDLAVTMSYERIRAMFHRFANILDAVTTPRLVVCDAADDDVVLVTRSRPDPETKRETTPGSRTRIKVEQFLESENSEKFLAESGEGQGREPTIRLTGLRDWSSCIFGDPLFAPAFSHPTPEFERGFHGRSHSYASVIEDQQNAPHRLLLYECYHAAVALVGQFYRPSTNSSEREITARRRLTAVLTKLEHASRDGEGDMPPVKRPRRPSNEDWPSKKQKDDGSGKKRESP